MYAVTKIFLRNFIPIIYSVIYHYQNVKKKVNLRRKSHWGSWRSCGSSLIALSSGFTVIRVLFGFLIDRILFRVLSDRVFFDSSVIESSSGFAVIDSSLGSSVLFFRHIAIFLSNRATIFFKNRCFVLHSFYAQKQFIVF